MSRALIVFARPLEGEPVKTRLTTLVTPDEARSLYAAFVQDAASRLNDLPVDVRWYFSKKPPWRPVGDRASLHVQTGRSLGTRMKQAFAETFSAGYTSVVIVGTDVPTLPIDRITSAFEFLDPGDGSRHVRERRVVIGPSADGGYHLLGMDQPSDYLFDGLTFSHGSVFEQALGRIASYDVQPKILPVWYDVDVPEDLRTLAADLEGCMDRAPRTAIVMRTIVAGYPEFFLPRMESSPTIPV